MGDHKEEEKSMQEERKGISRRSFLKTAGALAGLAGITAASGGLASNLEASQTSGIEKYGEAKDLGPMVKTIMSPTSRLVYGYWTAKELDQGSVVGGQEIYVSKDTKNWFKTNLDRRSNDIAGRASISVYDALLGPKSGDVYFLTTSGVSLGYKDTQSGAGFMREPGKLEVLRAKGADLSVVGNFEGGTVAEQRQGFLNLVSRAEGK